MEVSGRRQADSEDWDTCILCDSCFIDNVGENAQAYCINCDEFLCNTCAIHHRKNKASRRHHLLDRDEMPTKKISNDQDKFCAKHDGKLVEYLCDKHNTFCCTLCVTLDHLHCGVKCIDDLAAEFSTSQEYKSLLKHIKDTEKQLTENKNKMLHDSADVSTFSRQVQADIQVFRNEINSKLNALEQEILQQAGYIKEEDLKSIKSMDTINGKLLGNMSEISSSLGLLEKCKQNKQLFIFSKKAQTQVKEYSDRARTMLQNSIVRRYALTRKDNILNALNKLGSLEIKRDGRTKHMEQTGSGITKEDNNTIGRLGIRKTEDRREEQQTRRDEKKTLKTDVIKPTKFKITKKIKLNLKGDTSLVSITGNVLMSKDLLAVVDRSNYSIKVVDLRSDTITSYIKLENKPWDITYINPGTLVVTSDTHLEFLRYEGKLSLVQTVPMESGCSGITCSSNKLFVTFRGKHPSVKILNIEGKVLQTFQHNDKGQNLFSDPQYITGNRYGDTMYVSNYKRHTVTSLSMDGTVRYIYKHDSLRNPMGLTMDDEGCIYVSGNWSDNIHQITTNCAHTRIALEWRDSLRSPQTVLFSNTDKTLYVGNDSLSSYKLE